MKVSNRFASASLLLFLLFVASCGFKPAYRIDNNPTNRFLANIEVVPINSVEGAIFYDHMMNILPQKIESLYILDVNMVFSNESSIIEQNSDTLRNRLTLRISYNIREKYNSQIITSGKFVKSSSFSTGFSSYSSLILQQDEKRYLAISAAEEVRNRIMLFIEKKNYS